MKISQNGSSDSDWQQIWTVVWRAPLSNQNFRVLRGSDNCSVPFSRYSDANKVIRTLTLETNMWFTSKIRLTLMDPTALHVCFTELDTARKIWIFNWDTNSKIRFWSVPSLFFKAEIGVRSLHVCLSPLDSAFDTAFPIQTQFWPFEIALCCTCPYSITHIHTQW